MALTPRSFLRFIGKTVAPLIPGVGTSLGSVIEMVAGNPDKPSGKEMEEAVKLVEKIRAAKPSIQSSEFAFAAAVEAALTTIVYTESMPDIVRAVAAFGMGAIPLGYMYVRMRAKEKKAEKA